MLKVDRVQLSRGTSKPISFELLPGQIIWLKGRNAIGKSTLLKSLLLQEKIFAGEIRFNKLLLSSTKAPHFSEIFSYCPQHSEYLEDLKVARVLELLDIQDRSEVFLPLGLSDLISKSISQISQGEKQRLDIAIALSRTCSVSILDEPFASQDSKWISEIIKIIINQTLKGKSFIITSHLEFDLAQKVVCKKIELI